MLCALTGQELLFILIKSQNYLFSYRNRPLEAVNYRSLVMRPNCTVMVKHCWMLVCTAEQNMSVFNND